MRITKQLGYAINWLVTQNKTIDDICNELNLTTKQVTSYIEKHCLTNSKPLATKSESTQVKSKELMIRHTSNKKTNNVAIMTREASELNDGFKKQIKIESNRNSNCIFKPN